MHELLFRLARVGRHRDGWACLRSK